MMTINGIVIINRTVLIRTLPYDKNNENYEVIPLDELLQINKLPFKITRSMMLEIVYEAQRASSYDDAAEQIEKHYGYKISKDLVRKVTVLIGNLVYEQDKLKAERTQNNIINSIDNTSPKKDGILYLLTDGAAVNTRIQDENGSTWRENKLGLAFSSDNVIKRGKKENSGYKIIKKEYTSFIGNVEEFGKFFYQIAINQGYGKYKTVIILSDGATWIKNLCELLFPDAILILDKFHLDENIYDYAKAIFNNDEKKYKPWAKMIIKYIMDDKIDKALDEIDKVNFEKIPKGTVNLKGYINNNKERIHYKEYIKKGYYVGSGAIESGNKTVLQKRLKQAGMRWGVPTAQAMLSIRAKFESGLWDEVKHLVYNAEF